MQRTKLDLSLLPDLSALRAQVQWEYTTQNYIESKGSFELSIAFARLFWPELVERNGCILRADVLNEADFERWWRETAGDITAVERVLNQLHVETLVPSDSTELDESVYRYLATILVETWSARVKVLYPDREFVVACEDCDDSTIRGGPTVYLFQAPKGVASGRDTVSFPVK